MPNIYGKGNYHLFNNLLAFIDLQYRYIQLNMNGKDDKYDARAGTMRVLSNQQPFRLLSKVGLSYKINTANSVFAFAVANREPNRNNYTDAGPTEKPTSERLYDTELGYNHQSDV